MEILDLDVPLQCDEDGTVRVENSRSLCTRPEKLFAGPHA